jgi:hypothetical protein
MEWTSEAKAALQHVPFAQLFQDRVFEQLARRFCGTSV